MNMPAKSLLSPFFKHTHSTKPICPFTYRLSHKVKYTSQKEFHAHFSFIIQFISISAPLLPLQLNSSSLGHVEILCCFSNGYLSNLIWLDFSQYFLHYHFFSFFSWLLILCSSSKINIVYISQVFLGSLFSFCTYPQGDLLFSRQKPPRCQ